MRGFVSGFLFFQWLNLLLAVGPDAAMAHLRQWFPFWSDAALSICLGAEIIGVPLLLVAATINWRRALPISDS